MKSVVLMALCLSMSFACAQSPEQPGGEAPASDSPRPSTRAEHNASNSSPDLRSASAPGQAGDNADAAVATKKAGMSWSNAMPDLTPKPAPRGHDDSAVMRFQPIDIGADRRVDTWAAAKAEAAMLEAAKKERDNSSFIDKVRAGFSDDPIMSAMRSSQRPTYKPVPGFVPDWKAITEKFNGLTSGEQELLAEAVSPEHQARLEFEIADLREQRRQRYLGGAASGFFAGLIAKTPWLLGGCLLLWLMITSMKRAARVDDAPPKAAQPRQQGKATDAPPEEAPTPTAIPSNSLNLPDLEGHLPTSVFMVGDISFAFHESPPAVSQRHGIEPLRRYLLAARVFVSVTNETLGVYTLETGFSGSLHFCRFGQHLDHDNLGDGDQLAALPVFEAAVLHAVCQSRGLDPRLAKRLKL